ncbi:MAG TPA: sorbosone dehydrogenase family protein [Abditibacteriaceae bacterium]
MPHRIIMKRFLFAALLPTLALPISSVSAQTPAAQAPILTGEAARGDWTTDAPGVRRRITTADLPAPFDTPSANNGARVVPRPEGAWPQAPAGFVVSEFATGLRNPRVVTTAPNGDVFVAESGANRVRVLRDADGDGKAETSEVFAENLKQPFGIAFYPKANPQWVYVANTDSVVRFAYTAGATKAVGEPEMIVNSISGGGLLRGGGHWTRDIAFSDDGTKMWVSVGSRSNVSDDEGETGRALIWQFTPEGKDGKVYASGIRNPVGLAVDPRTGVLWTSVNERDGLGDHLVPDYITSVREGGFYGWPWFYIGGNQDPRHKDKHPELKDTVIVPDVLLQSHSASLDLAFYTGNSFPAEYRNSIFAAEHGSWNRERRTGYKVIRVPMAVKKSMNRENSNVATGEYEDFLTGFVTPEGNVWGRPVGVTVANDGALLVSDDGGNVIWRVAAAKK